MNADRLARADYESEFDDGEDADTDTDADADADNESLPFVQFARGTREESDPDNGGIDRSAPTGGIRTRWIVAAAVVVVVVGMVIGIVVFNRSAPATARGARTAASAADGFVRAVNSGNLAGAAAISCTDFADQAKAAATTAKDPAIDFTLNSLRMLDRTNAVAMLTERLTFSATTKQTMHLAITVQRSSGRWLMCGQAT